MRPEAARIVLLADGVVEIEQAPACYELRFSSHVKRKSFARQRAELFIGFRTENFMVEEKGKTESEEKIAELANDLNNKNNGPELGAIKIPAIERTPSARKTPKKKGKTKKSAAKAGTKTGTARTPKPFPASSFEEALTIPDAIQKHASGQKVRRLTLFDQIGKSPDSSMGRQWITNANRYGLAKGSYAAEYLELTPEGAIATGTEVPPREKLMARFKLAIDGIPAFKILYDSQKGNRLPAASVLEDIVRENGVPTEYLRECVETFMVNAKFLGVLRLIAGAERIVSIEQALEDLPRTSFEGTSGIQRSAFREGGADENPISTAANFADTCFYISPIGEEDSEDRKHADLFLGSIVEPALEEFGLKVVRADKIGKPGMITAQIIEYILRSKLVVADLSYHNPNVFYELALRHICRLPTVQIIRLSDRIPFDLDQVRTIQIDTTDIYSLVPKLQTYKAEIATQVRAALANSDSVDNPLSTYYPNLKVSF